VLALFIVVSALVLTTLATALADSHPAAADGQRLEDQSAEVQALYRAVYGDDAEARWIAEHNAAIGMSMMDDSMMMDDPMDPTASMYYGRIVAVAMARGADADLASRIAVDVIGRGTEAAFLAGTDAGVLYGIGTSEDDINNPPAPAPSAPSAPAPAPRASSGWGGTIEHVLTLNKELKFNLPSVEREDDETVRYSCSNVALPTYASLNSFTGEITAKSAAIAAETKSTCQVYVDGTLRNDDNGSPLKVTVKLKVVNPDEAPVFATSQNTVKGYQNVDLGTVTLPVAHRGDGTELEYKLKPTPFGLTFDGTAATRTLTGTPRGYGTVQVTYTAEDDDGDKATITFDVVVEMDEEVEFNVGSTWSVVAKENELVTLPSLKKDGNGGITWTTTELVDAQGTMERDNRALRVAQAYDASDGASNSFTFTYTATEKKQSDLVTGGHSDSVTITVNVIP